MAMRRKEPTPVVESENPAPVETHESATVAAPTAAQKLAEEMKKPAGPQEPAKQDAPKEPATPPVVRKQAAAPVSAASIMNEVIYADLRDKFIAEFGTLPRLKPSQGLIYDNDGVSLGSWIIGQVLSWNQRFTITTGDNDAPDTLVRFSLDNSTLDDGSGVSVANYIAELKAAGYPDACSKEYYEVIFNLVKSEQPSPLIGGMVQIQLSPTSRKEFDSFRLQTTFKISNGFLQRSDVELIQMTSTPTVNKQKKQWSKFKFTIPA